MATSFLRDSEKSKNSRKGSIMRVFGRKVKVRLVCDEQERKRKITQVTAQMKGLCLMSQQ